MNEAERCDRISLMHAGRVLVSDAPAALMRVAVLNHSTMRSSGTLEDASKKSRARGRIAAFGQVLPQARYTTNPEARV